MFFFFGASTGKPGRNNRYGRICFISIVELLILMHTYVNYYCVVQRSESKSRLVFESYNYWVLLIQLPEELMHSYYLK
ncbi:hypothetical protein A3860_14915 [Niastella vici]|uniref:Uncharacterized protein n=1 Tax=Niastella vici TaxID=1703345 RepID=A0A1V9G5G7_9BACT|nr:hypothetical protein A3860_14915 [Niastella vici]